MKLKTKKFIPALIGFLIAAAALLVGLSWYKQQNKHRSIKLVHREPKVSVKVPVPDKPKSAAVRQPARGTEGTAYPGEKKQPSGEQIQHLEEQHQQEPMPAQPNQQPDQQPADITALNREIYLLRKEKEKLKLEVEIAELKKKLGGSFDEPDKKALQTQQLDRLLQKLNQLQMEIDALKKKKFSIAIPPPRRLKVEEKLTSVRVVAVMDGAAIIEVNGKKLTVKDGDRVSGKRVKILPYGVRIGKNVYELAFSETKGTTAQGKPLSLPGLSPIRR